MKSFNESLLNNAIKALNELGIKNEDIMILGSIALDLCGMFPDYRKQAHDVDVLIRCSEEKKEEITKIAKFLNSQCNGSDKSTIVMPLPYVILNIWFTKDQFDSLLRLQNGVYVEEPLKCIEKKKKYSRYKDLQDINSILRQILS